MPKVGSSLVDIPVSVNREGVCIMTRFPESSGDDGPDHATTTAPLEDFVLSVTSADEMPALKCSEDRVLKLLRPKTDRQEMDGRVSVTRPPDPDCDSRGLRLDSPTVTETRDEYGELLTEIGGTPEPLRTGRLVTLR